MNPYQHCTRCGDELSDELKEAYMQEDITGPTLCKGCLLEVFQGVPKAMQPMFEAMAEAFNSMVEPIVDAINAVEEHKND